MSTTSTNGCHLLRFEYGKIVCAVNGQPLKSLQIRGGIRMQYYTILFARRKRRMVGAHFSVGATLLLAIMQENRRTKKEEKLQFQESVKMEIFTKLAAVWKKNLLSLLFFCFLNYENFG